MNYYKITQHLNEFAYNYIDWVIMIASMLAPIAVVVWLVILLIRHNKESK